MTAYAFPVSEMSRNYRKRERGIHSRYKVTSWRMEMLNSIQWLSAAGVEIKGIDRCSSFHHQTSHRENLASLSKTNTY